MRTYEVVVNHYYDEERVKHIHRVQMPHKVWLDLKSKYGSAIWPFHRWVEDKLEEKLGKRYDNDTYKSRYYIYSCKVIR